MKVRLIQPSQLNENGRPKRFRKLFFPNLGLPTIAALTPAGIDVGITIEYMHDVDLDEDVDLVGITAQTCQAPRAYQLAAEFRKRGKRTIMGGIHASACPEEALGHFDSVLIGEAEGLWDKVLSDVAAGGLQRIYQAEVRPGLSVPVVPRYDLLDYSDYVIPPFARTPLIPIQATRGCPHACDFCSVSEFWGHQVRKKPVANVVREIEVIDPSRVFFTDDNIGADPGYARELFGALGPLKKRWACQMSTTIGRQPDLIAAAADAGCHETYMGIESLNPRSLDSIRKGFNRTDEYEVLFRRLADVGILAQVSLIFGLDDDTADDLRRMIDVVMGWDINYVYIAILTPFPGTRLYDRFKRDGRISTADWSPYDVTRVVFNPKLMDAKQLEDLVFECFGKYYSTSSIFRRAWHFRRQYLRYCPRDNVVEETFFQFHIKSSVEKRCHPFSLGFEV